VEHSVDVCGQPALPSFLLLLRVSGQKKGKEKIKKERKKK
jgi:hypothetical protein